MIEKFSEYKSVKVVQPYFTILGILIVASVFIFLLSMVALPFNAKLGTIGIYASVITVGLSFLLMHIFEKHVRRIILKALEIEFKTKNETNE